MRNNAPQPLTPRSASPAEPLALLVVAVLLLAGITWGLHPQYSWDVDNTAPGSVLKAIAQKFGPRWSSSYGPVPYFTMALPMIPMLVAFKFSHELGTPSGTYPWGFAHPDFSVNALTLGARVAESNVEMPPLPRMMKGLAGTPCPASASCRPRRWRVMGPRRAWSQGRMARPMVAIRSPWQPDRRFST